MSITELPRKAGVTNKILEYLTILLATHYRMGEAHKRCFSNGNALENPLRSYQSNN